MDGLGGPGRFIFLCNFLLQFWAIWGSDPFSKSQKVGRGAQSKLSPRLPQYYALAHHKELRLDHSYFASLLLLSYNMKIYSFLLLLHNLFPNISANKEVQGNLVDCPELTGKFPNEEDPSCSIYFHCKNGKGFEGRRIGSTNQFLSHKNAYSNFWGVLFPLLP